MEDGLGTIPIFFGLESTAWIFRFKSILVGSVQVQFFWYENQRSLALDHIKNPE